MSTKLHRFLAFAGSAACAGGGLLLMLGRYAVTAKDRDDAS